MGIIPKRTAEEQAAYDLSLDRAFGETPTHLKLLIANPCGGDCASCTSCGKDFMEAVTTEEQAARDAALDESFGEGPIAVALAGRRFDR